MNLKNWIPLVAALLLGLIALVVARKALSKGDGQATNAPVTTVVVTNKDLPVGHQLKPTDLAVKRVTADGVIGGSFPTADKLDGRTVVVPLKAGDYVIDSMLAPTGSGGGLSAMIPQGFRAMTLEVNEFTGVAGMIQPGSKVDVMAVLRDEKSALPAVRMILQNVEVRAVGRNVAPPPSDPGAPPPPPTNNVTVLLSPRDAQILQLATQNGRPWLVMRNGVEKGTVESELITLAALKGDARNQGAPGGQGVEPAAAVPAMDPGEDPFGAPRKGMTAARVVQVIRGGVESNVTFGATVTPTSAGSTTRPATPPARPLDPPRILTGAGAESMKPE